MMRLYLIQSRCYLHSCLLILSSLFLEPIFCAHPANEIQFIRMLLWFAPPWERRHVTDPKRRLDNDAFFRERVQQQVLEPVCMACHVASGSARESDLVLSTIVVPNYLDINQASMSNMAGLGEMANRGYCASPSI